MNNAQSLWSVRQVIGQGGLPKLQIETPWSEAEIYLHGAHVTHFQKKGENPILFLSGSSQFQEGKAIRGGIPLIFPWFGAKAGGPNHGIGRTNRWELIRVRTTLEGGVILRFLFPKNVNAPGFPPFEAEYEVEVGESVGLRLMFRNASNQELTLEDCLHTYFQVGAIQQVAIRGLQGTEYSDNLDGDKRKKETSESIVIGSEVDRIYLNTRETVEIQDASLKRVIRIEKEASASTVVWNPWINKSKATSDFGDEEYLQMVCIESGNVAENRRTLAPGDRVSTVVKISTTAL